MMYLWCSLSFIAGGVLATLWVCHLINKHFNIERKEKQK